jgi:hypothetical protein
MKSGKRESGKWKWNDDLAAHRSADWQSAVSRIVNPRAQDVAALSRLPVGDTAGYQPALRRLLHVVSSEKRCRRCALPPHSKFFAFRHHEIRDSDIHSAFRFPACHFI